MAKYVVFNVKGNKTPPVTMSTDAVDIEEGDAITKMILDNFPHHH